MTLQDRLETDPGPTSGLIAGGLGLLVAFSEVVLFGTGPRAVLVGVASAAVVFVGLRALDRAARRLVPKRRGRGRWQAFLRDYPWHYAGGTGATVAGILAASGLVRGDPVVVTLASAVVFGAAWAAIFGLVLRARTRTRR